MEPEVGKILEGKITGITNFGAFVMLPDGKSGLVHISEIADCYVKDIHDFLEVGQTVNVLVMNVSDDGKINLSVKRAAGRNEDGQMQREEKQEHRDRTQKMPRFSEDNCRSTSGPSSGADAQFEEKLKRFMQESDSRLASNPMYAEHKKKTRRR